MIISMILLSIITIIITTLIIIFQYRHYKAIENLRKRNIPIGKQPSFFNAILNQIRIELVTNENVKKIGKIYGWEMFGGINLTVAEPDLIQQILNKEFQNFPNRRKLNTDDPFFSNFLSTIELEQWKRIRSIVAPTFATGKLRRMKPCMDSICQTLITNIGNGIDETLKNNVDNNKEMNILNIKRYAGAFTMDTVLQVAFGCKIDSLIEPNNQVILMAKKLFSTDLTVKNLIAFLFTFFLPPIFSKIFHIRINGDVTDFFAQFASDIIEQKRQEFAAKDFSKASTFIEFLLEAEHELHQRRSNSIESYNTIDLNNNDNDDKMNDNENTNDQNNNDNNNNVNVDDKKLIKYMTNDEIMAQCVLFFLAGYDTTATTITMALYYLSLNPECQEIAFNEIETVLRSKSNDADDNNDDDGKKSLESLSFDEINTKFEYINGIVNETLRMTPPAPFTERRCMKDIELSTNDGKTMVKFEKDDIIQIPIWNLHYDNEYFPDSEKFEPKRFTHDYEHRYPSYAYLPFGSGPRACVAKSLALIEAKLALIWLIKHFKFDKCSKTKIPVEFYNQGGLLSPRDIYLKVERR